MQIHELNFYNGSLDANACLAVDNGTDTGKITVPALLSDVVNDVNELDETVNARIDNIIAGGAAPSEAEIIDARHGENGEDYTSLGAAIRGQYSDLKTGLVAVDQGIAKTFVSLFPYLYRENVYLNNGVETAKTGYDTYKIPCGPLDIVQFKWTSDFWGNLGSSYIFSIQKEDDSFEAVITGNGQNNYEFIGPQLNAIFLGTNGSNSVKNIFVTVKRTNATDVSLAINNAFSILKDPNTGYKFVQNLDVNDFVLTKYYINSSNKFARFDLASTSYTIFVKAKKGDRFEFADMPSVSNYTNIRYSDGSNALSGTAASVTLANDGVVNIFLDTGYNSKITYYPNDAAKIESKNIIGNSNVFDQFAGMDGVAFGTSLTYRSQTTGGYLNFLPGLSGITFDNQGIGDSSIKGDMLTAIKNYSSYSGKQICIIEGFVNDWNYHRTLGTYTDATEDTVCGCVRSAINYILAQNADITVFLVLDHYGRNYGGDNRSSTAKNSNNQTQFEFYEEIAKVAESLGIPVIKLYSFSGISENTPQYLLDYIHPNALGAEQTAYAIWSRMRTYYPNLV